MQWLARAAQPLRWHDQRVSRSVVGMVMAPARLSRARRRALHVRCASTSTFAQVAAWREYRTGDCSYLPADSALDVIFVAVALHWSWSSSEASVRSRARAPSTLTAPRACASPLASGCLTVRALPERISPPDLFWRDHPRNATTDIAKSRKSFP